MGRCRQDAEGPPRGRHQRPGHGRRAGVTGTPHALRHHYGTQVLRTSGDLRTAQRALRHASPASTAIYTQVADDALYRAIAGIPA